MDKFTPKAHCEIEVTPSEFELKEVCAREQVTPVSLQLGARAFDLLSAYSLVDRTTVGAQARAAIEAYHQHRLQDPDFLDSIIRAERRSFLATE